MSDTQTSRPLSHDPAFRWIAGIGLAIVAGAALWFCPPSLQGALRAALGIETLVGNALAANLVLCGIGAVLGFLIGMVLAGRVRQSDSTGHEERDFADDQDTGQALLTHDEPADSAGWDHDNEVDAVADAISQDHEDPAQRMFNPRDHLAEDTMAGERAEPIDAEFDEIAEDSAPLEPRQDLVDPLAYPSPASPTFPSNTDVPLGELTARLERALVAARDAATEIDAERLDPTVAFLRREADRVGGGRADPEADAQSSLRDALDRLSQVNRDR